MTVALIVAMNQKRVIGVGGGLPWRLPNELAYFKSVTQGKAVIMGRKTFESLGKRALKNRMNVVVSRQPDYVCKDCVLANSVDHGIAQVRQSYQGEVFVIGGSQVYQAVMPVVERLYITVVDSDVSGDVYFPYGLDELRESGWIIDHAQAHPKDARHESAFTCYQLVRAATL